MSWQDDMKADAAKIAFGDGFEPGDEVLLTVEYDPGFAYSSYTFEDPCFEVRICLPARGMRCTYSNAEVNEFMVQLMTARSAP